MRYVALAISLALCPASLVAEQIVEPLVGGRTVQQPDGSYRFGWPATYFEGGFTGTAISIDLDSGGQIFRVLVDGQERKRVEEAFNGRLLIDGLPQGEHVIRLEKLSESQNGASVFRGFRAIDGQALPPRRRMTAIELIGDSHSVGYGNISDSRDCSAEQLHARTDSQQAFGPLLAKRLDADYRVIAYSGFGVVRNYAGNAPTLSLPKIYDRAIPGEVAIASAGGWNPQHIFVYLGTNDFSTALKPDEKWRDQAALRKDWQSQYVRFVTALQQRQPQAQIRLMAADKFLADAGEVSARLRAANINAPVLRVPALSMTGCHWHPSVTDQQLLADLAYKDLSKPAP